MGHWSKKCEHVSVVAQNSDMRSRAKARRASFAFSQSNNCHYISFAPFIKESVKRKLASKFQM